MKKTLLFALIMSAFVFTGFAQIFEKTGAGITILVHGWNPDDSQPGWMNPMANAIIARSGGGQIATITVTGTAGNLTATCTDWVFDLSNPATTGEIVILVNWTAVANHLTKYVTAQEVAGAVAPIIYQSQNGEPILATLPIHLIGHSRGGGMVFEIARLLGLQGIEVEQVTALDPHPLTEADPQPTIGPHTIDTPIKIYENILFVDSYYQNIESPTGQYVTGAYNRLWTNLPGGYHDETGYTYTIGTTTFNFSDHLNIILMYHGTIDLTTPVNNGEATLEQADRDVWFNVYETQGEIEGFYYSRNISGNRKSSDIPSGGDAVIDGFHNDALLGGNGARTAQNWTNAFYPNILTVNASVNTVNLINSSSNNIYLNDNIQVTTTFRTNQNAATIAAYLDTDRNPFNSSMTSVVDASVLATSSTITQQSLSFNVPALTVGQKYYLLVEITDGTEQRFLYAPYEFDFPVVTQTSDIKQYMPVIFPNPTEGQFRIQNYGLEITNIEITDISGKVSKSFSISQIDISDYPCGIYFLKITTDEGVFTKKIIKQ